MQTCIQCQSDWLDQEVTPLTDARVLVPGQTVPSGNCPGCGHFCYPKRPELSEDWMLRVQTSLNTIAREINTTRELLHEVNASPACFAVGAVLADCLRMVQRTFAHEFHLTMLSEEQVQAIQEAINQAAVELEEAEDKGIIKFPAPEQEN